MTETECPHGRVVMDYGAERRDENGRFWDACCLECGEKFEVVPCDDERCEWLRADPEGICYAPAKSESI